MISFVIFRVIGNIFLLIKKYEHLYFIIVKQIIRIIAIIY